MRAVSVEEGISVRVSERERGGLVVRSVAPEEFEGWVGATDAAFGREPRESGIEGLWALAEFDRTVAAFDGREMVGTANAFSRELTVPGGVLPAAAVTAVSVLPTHRRRGILTRMMRHQLEDVRGRGEPLAVLGATESGIYGRFGYGMAAEGVSFEIERDHAALSVEEQTPGRVRLVPAGEALEIWPGVYDRVRRQTPGALGRSWEWWENRGLPGVRHGGEKNPTERYAVYEDGGSGEASGYLRYRTERRWEDGLPRGELRIQELVSASSEAYAALWRYAFGVDLMATVRGTGRPVDEPLYWMLADPRRLRRKPSDSLWLRIVDVPAALAGRSYPAPGRLVLGVRDPFLPEVEGTYELAGGPDGGECRASRDEPDVVLGAADLASVYLGGVSPSTLARAGRVRGSRTSLGVADRMFAWNPRPWSP